MWIECVPVYFIIRCNRVVEECPLLIDQLQSKVEKGVGGRTDVEGFNNRPVNKTTCYYDVTIDIVTINNSLKKLNEPINT